MEQLEITGSPIDGDDKYTRSYVVEEAIAAIRQDPTQEFCLGVKVYSGFGDQRFDMRGCPRHGSIVFRIARKSGFDGPFDQKACVYFLQAVRDFKPNPDTKLENLANALQRISQLEKETALISALIENTEYDFDNTN